MCNREHNDNHARPHGSSYVVKSYARMKLDHGWLTRLWKWRETRWFSVINLSRQTKVQPPGPAASFLALMITPFISYSMTIIDTVGNRRRQCQNCPKDKMPKDVHDFVGWVRITEASHVHFPLIFMRCFLWTTLS